jgi:hypothetical protein
LRHCACACGKVAEDAQLCRSEEALACIKSCSHCAIDEQEAPACRTELPCRKCAKYADCMDDADKSCSDSSECRRQQFCSRSSPDPSSNACTSCLRCKHNSTAAGGSCHSRCDNWKHGGGPLEASVEWHIHPELGNIFEPKKAGATVSRLRCLLTETPADSYRRFQTVASRCHPRLESEVDVMIMTNSNGTRNTFRW